MIRLIWHVLVRPHVISVADGIEGRGMFGFSAQYGPYPPGSLGHERQRFAENLRSFARDVDIVLMEKRR